MKQFNNVRYRSIKARFTLATMSKQHCRSNRQLCCLLLRQCCWCGPGLRRAQAKVTTEVQRWGFHLHVAC